MLASPRRIQGLERPLLGLAGVSAGRCSRGHWLARAGWRPPAGLTDGHPLFLHRFVLAVGSAVFDAMFNGGMATTSTEIELPDVEPAAFLALLKYVSGVSDHGEVVECGKTDKHLGTPAEPTQDSGLELSWRSVRVFTS